MKIFKLDNEQLLNEIEKNVIITGKPIILMNEQTINFIIQQYSTFIKEKDTKYIKTMYGCHIAIADWLDFGEVQLVHEISTYK